MSMPAAHRHGDLRSCGATTVVTNQGFVKVDGKLWAVEGDMNTDLNGALIATQSFVTIAGKKVIVNTPDHAQPDDLCPILDTEHCDPKTAQGSPETTVGGP